MKALRLAAVLMAVPFLATVADAQALKVGYGAFTAPTTFLPGATADDLADPGGSNAQGALIDAIKAVAKDAGFQVTFVPLPAGGTGGNGGNGGGYGVGGSGQTAALTGNTIDIIAGAPYSATTPDAEAALMFAVSMPIYTTSEALLVKKADATPYKTWDDLKGQVVGTLTGSVADGALQMSMLFQDVKTYATVEDVAAAVGSGEIKAAILPGAPNIGYRLRQGDLGDLQMVASYQPHFIFDVAIGVRQGDPLLAQINASVAKLKADGTLKTIFAKYGIDGALVP